MKSNAAPQTVTAGLVPPYCYRLPEMSADEAAVVAVREMRISHPCDALALLWELRREALAAETSSDECPAHNPYPKNATTAHGESCMAI